MVDMAWIYGEWWSMFFNLFAYCYDCLMYFGILALTDLETLVSGSFSVEFWNPISQSLTTFNAMDIGLISDFIEWVVARLPIGEYNVIEFIIWFIVAFGFILFAIRCLEWVMPG